MKRFLLALSLVAVAAVPARAHFVWLLPDADKGTVRMVFSDGLEPDDNEKLLDRIKQTQLSSINGEGKSSVVKFDKDGTAFALKLGDGKEGQVIVGTCRYGVFQRGDAEPALLQYYAKTFIGGPAKDPKKQFTAATEKLDLDIVFADKGKLKVLWKGKPLAKTKVFLITSTGKKAEDTTDDDGNVALKAGDALKDLKKGGLIGLRVGHTVKEAGELDGKKYTSTKHWATFVIDAGYLQIKPVDPSQTSDKAEAVEAKAERKEDADATKLLADARAARANWDNFPGFSADLELNVEGRVVKGKVEVDAKGKVTLTGIDDKGLDAWTKRQMASIVGHRMSDGSSLKTPCAFIANDQDHPLGRAIQVLNDEFHSSYRIRDRQVIVVNRMMKDSRFTITVLENKQNAEKQYLPAHYVVNTWDLTSNALKSSATFFHDWTRIDKFDLPGTSMIVTANSEGKLEARKLVLSNHKLK